MKSLHRVPGGPADKKTGPVTSAGTWYPGTVRMNKTAMHGGPGNYVYWIHTGSFTMKFNLHFA